MPTGYLIFVKRPNTNVYVPLEDNSQNWFLTEDEALERCKNLNDTMQLLEKECGKYHFIVTQFD